MALPIELESIAVERAGALWRHANLELGIEGIDAQHAWLVVLILEMEWVLRHDPQHVPDRFRELTEQVREYADLHFTVEEQVFSELGYAEQDAHCGGHRKFMALLEDLLQGNRLKHRDDAERLYRFLRKWLVQHILVEDRKYADFFQRRKIIGEANACFARLNEDEVYLSKDKRDFFNLITRRYRHISVSTPEILKRIDKLWRDLKLRIHVPIIDIQHLWLIKLIVDMDAAIDESDLTREAVLASTLEECVNYIEVHFRTEEAMMKLLNYENSSEHMARHRRFEEFIRSRQLNLEEGSSRSAVMLVKDLREWLTNHIALEDKKFVGLYEAHKQAVLEFSKREILSGDAKIRRNQMELYKVIVKSE